MVTGIERGNTDDTFTWDGKLAIAGTSTLTGNVTCSGNLAVTGTTALTGNITIGGNSINRRTILTLTASTLTTATTTGTKFWTIPAGATVTKCMLYVDHADDSTLTICIGTNSTAYDNFLKLLPVSTGTSVGLYTGVPSVQTVGSPTALKFILGLGYVGTLLANYTAGVDAAVNSTGLFGYYAPIVAYFATATDLFFKCSGTAANSAVRIFIDYTV